MMSRAIAVAAAAALAWVAPAWAQQSSASPEQSGSQQQSGGQKEVSEQDLQGYVKALQAMAQFEPGIQQALESGRPVDASVLDRIPRDDARQAIEQAGLSQDEFGWITEQLNEDPSAREQFKQVAQQQAQQSGGSQSGQSPSGAQPAPSPQ